MAAGLKKLNLDWRVFLLALLAGLPGSAVAIVLLLAGGFSLKVQVTLILFVLLVWLGAAAAARSGAVRPIQTFSNLVAALREGDYSIRARDRQPVDDLGFALFELSALSEQLHNQRLSELESNALLRQIIEEIDVAVLAFDADGKLKLLNRAAQQLLNVSSEEGLNRRAAELGLTELLEGEVPRTLDKPIGGMPGPWELRRGQFRQGGLPRTLVVLSDLRRALRQEERQAWQRLVRVLGHEINNSLAPIHSISSGLQELLKTHTGEGDWVQDVRDGLAVVERRSAGLSRFMAAYSQLARLPPPRLGPVELDGLVGRIAALERRLSVKVAPSPPLCVRADADQLEQLLINLIRNAADAALETGGGVEVSWKQNGATAEILVADEGPGLSGSANLFVPFFTTKPEGSGIGLVLSRQIAEAHSGTLTLHNSASGRGCNALLRLPVQPAA
ncbi:MAG TPA: ATP-binding protein [Myxococcaceae bacterium]|nr:ATP-binding protein [Myxococcaceae bacterium]